MAIVILGPVALYLLWLPIKIMAALYDAEQRNKREQALIALARTGNQQAIETCQLRGLKLEPKPMRLAKPPRSAEPPPKQGTLGPWGEPVAALLLAAFAIAFFWVFLR